MPEWARDLLLAVIGSGSIAAGVGWWFKSRREDRIRAEDARSAKEKALEARVEGLYAKVESLLVDAIARERESNAQAEERMAMDAKQNEVISAATGVMKESAVALAHLEALLRERKP